MNDDFSIISKVSASKLFPSYPPSLVPLFPSFTPPATHAPGGDKAEKEEEKEKQTADDQPESLCCVSPWQGCGGG